MRVQRSSDLPGSRCRRGTHPALGTSTDVLGGSSGGHRGGAAALPESGEKQHFISKMQRPQRFGSEVHLSPHVGAFTEPWWPGQGTHVGQRRSHPLNSFGKTVRVCGSVLSLRERHGCVAFRRPGTISVKGHRPPVPCRVPWRQRSWVTAIASELETVRPRARRTWAAPGSTCRGRRGPRGRWQRATVLT